MSFFSPINLYKRETAFDFFSEILFFSPVLSLDWQNPRKAKSLASVFPGSWGIQQELEFRKILTSNFYLNHEKTGHRCRTYLKKKKKKQLKGNYFFALNCVGQGKRKT